MRGRTHAVTTSIGHRPAFSLLEVLVVIAVIALLGGLLIPGLGAARSAAREAQCAAMQRQLYTAAMKHAHSNDDMLPGVNTTGSAYLGSVAAAERLLGDTSPATPTTVFDWISPSIGDVAGLSANRAERTRQIFEDFSCAEAGATANGLWGAAGVADAGQFRTALDTKGYRQISYLSPGPFHLTGAWYRREATARMYGWRGPAILPERYFPRLSRVGASHADKIFLADGTRYLANKELLDFDVHPRPKYYGSFTSSTPVYVASREYGKATGSPEFADENRASGERTVYPFNARMSYRHGGRMVTLRFDGSGETMTEAESKRDATPWFPGDSVFTGVNATPESLATHERGETLR